MGRLKSSLRFQHRKDRLYIINTVALWTGAVSLHIKSEIVHELLSSKPYKRSIRKTVRYCYEQYRYSIIREKETWMINRCGH